MYTFVGLIALAVLTAACHAIPGQYTIVAAKRIQPNSDYHVALTLHTAFVPATIQLTIFDYAAIPVHQLNVTVQPNTTELVAFQMGVLTTARPMQHYQLRAEGIAGIRLNHTQPLAVYTQLYSILLQTDRAAYKPGDLVRLRCLIIDAQTRPVHLNNSLQLIVTDSEQFRSQQWMRQSTPKGVFSASFRLPSAASPGKWTLQASSGTVSARHTFRVAGELRAVHCRLVIETDDNVLYRTGKVSANIIVHDVFGKPVHGNATIQLTKVTPTAEIVAEQHVRLFNAKVPFEFEFDRDAWFATDQTRHDLVLDVQMVEQFTEHRCSATAKIRVHRNEFSMATTAQTSVYTEGRVFGLAVVVKRFNGKPLNNRILTFVYSDDLELETKSLTTIIRDDGSAWINVKFPKNRTGILYELLYEKVVLKGVLRPEKKISHTGLKIIAINNSPRLNESATVLVRHLLYKIPYCTYVVIGRGDVLLSQTVISAMPSKELEFTFDVSFEMLPTVTILVFTTLSSKFELYTQSTSLHCQQSLMNNIDTSVRLDRVKPNGEVQLQIRSAPNAIVGLLAVNKQLFGENSDNGLQMMDVARALSEFGEENKASHIQNHHSKFATKRGVFEELGLFVISNIKELKQSNAKETNIADANVPQQQTNIENSRDISIRGLNTDTWLWMDIELDETGMKNITTRVPNQISTWQITGFSLSSDTGLGLTTNGKELLAYKPFFVSISVPERVRLGDETEVKVKVNNNYGIAMQAYVTLHNQNGDFLFVDNEQFQLNRTRRIDSISARDFVGVTFAITALKVGPLTLNFTASTPSDTDQIAVILTIMPIGVRNFVHQSVLVDLRQRSQFAQALAIEVPAGSVPNSSQLRVTAIGDYVGATFVNVDSLVESRVDCNIRFTINIALLNYLASVDRLTGKMNKVLRYESGAAYECLLISQLENGAFYVNSTLQTAYLLRSISMAAQFTVILDPNSTTKALIFLSNTQSPNGSFTEVDARDYSVEESLDLTARTLLAFLDNRVTHPDYSTVIAKATHFITTNQAQLDVDSIAVAAYALQLTANSARVTLLDALQKLAKVDEKYTYWLSAADSSPSVEISSYALLAYFHADRIAECVPILKWLLSQRNALGGFDTESATFMGFKAIAAIAQRLQYTPGQMSIQLSYAPLGRHVISVNPDNRMVMHRLQVPGSVRELQVSATGQGFCLVSLTLEFYSVNSSGFHIQTKAVVQDSLLELNICTGLLAPIGRLTRAVMEVQIPRGYSLNSTQLNALKAGRSVRQVEQLLADSLVVVHLENLSAEPVCQTIVARREFPVLGLSNATVTVFDYYDTSRRTESVYSPENRFDSVEALDTICNGTQTPLLFVLILGVALLSYRIGQQLKKACKAVERTEESKLLY